MKINQKSKQKDYYSLAVELYKKGNLQNAVALLNQIIKSNPNDFNALNFLGGIYFTNGDFHKSINYFQKVVSLFPFHPTAYYNLGLSFQSIGQDEKAEECYKKAVKIDPHNLNALNNLGVICLHQNRKTEAYDYFQKIITIDRKNSNAFNNLGNIKTVEKNYSEAESYYLKAIEIQPDNTTYLFNLANCYLNLEKFDESIKVLNKIIELNPAYYQAYNHLGVCLINKKEFTEAITYLENSIKLKNDFWEAYHNLGLCYEKLGRNSDAVSLYKHALEINKNNPNTIIKLSHVFLEEGNYAESEKYLNEIVDENAKVVSYVNTAVSKIRQGNLEEAIAYSAKALKENDQIAVTHYNFSHALLLLGNFKEGWKEYEWRKQVEGFAKREFSRPELTKELLKSAANKKILVCSEQGFGDTFHFIRFLPKLKSLGCYVIFECESLLASLLKNCSGFDQLIIKKNDLSEPQIEYDYFVYLLSLPGLFDTDLTNISANIPYIFVEAEKIDKWKSIVGNDNKLKVGIVWAGNPNHKNDRNRSCRIKQLQSLFELPFVQFYSLQKGKAVEQLYELNNSNIIDLETKLTSFDETAAAIMNLDLVISVDTSVAHLAAALGKNVWLMLPFAPDWRWLLNRTDSPWYPTMRLFRQKVEKDWSNVIEEIKSELLNLIEIKFDKKDFINFTKPNNNNLYTNKILNLALVNGENYGWGVCSKYLKKELSKKISIRNLDTNNYRSTKIEGDVFHALKNIDFESVSEIRGDRNFGYTFFESELTDKAVQNSHLYDIIFAGSTWCKEKMINAGILNSQVLIQGIDPEMFYPSDYERNDNLFVIFSGGKFELRKGQDLVIKAFEILHKKYSDMILINAWYNYWQNSINTMAFSKYINFELRGNNWHDFIANIFFINGIDTKRVFILPIVPNEKLRELYMKTDVGIFPNRCEGGTNLVLMEYMACGKPVIASYNTGHKDILTENNSIMLKEMKEFKLYDNNKLIAEWEEPLLDEIISKIEYAYNNREQLKIIGKRAGEYMKNFTWEKTADNLLSKIYN
ncbi:tetratricopeptide repeat protein [Melioribacteraceae bacterium 4301-Me]|uniref:tetratricopeptide repeat protein n=1 Tax=Pyranulibacter aquaticus TaxID=3163344 RepID=UPI00359B0477